MNCRICGDDKAQYRVRSRQVLCASCHRDTPRKVFLPEFIAATFGKDPAFDFNNYSDACIAREFYDDYRAGKYTDPAKYWAACSEPLDVRTHFDGA